MGISLGRTLSIIAVVYVIEGFPMGVYADVWPIYFRRHGVSLTEIGWLSGLYIAWSAKVLWSPLVDRLGERRHWIAGSMVVMAACLVWIGFDDLHRLGPVLWLVFILYCVASATQDVAIDAYAIGITERGREGPVNSMKITAYRVGLLTAGSGLLLLPGWIGWRGTFLVGAALSLAMASGVFAVPRVAIPTESRRETIAPLRRWLNRPGVIPVVGFILLYRVGDRAMGPMVKTFWVDRGLSDPEIAAVSATFGIGATVLGAIAGGVMVARGGIGRSLWLLGALALASNLGYAAAAAFPESGRAGIYAASGIESFCGGLASAAFLSYLMWICDKEHAAVQYALVTALYALAGSLVALPAGWLTERMGYAGYFALTALYALPAFAFLPGARIWLEGSDP